MMILHTPIISVLMPIFNCEKYVATAIESILTQTFTNFEFIIINDGSTDNSLSIIKQYARKDSRIKYFSQKNSGIVSSLKLGLEQAQGRYIARMDADDISLPTRLEKQYLFFKSNPRYGIVGSWVETFGQKNDIWHHRQFDNFIKNMLFFKTPGFSHSAVMMQKTLLDDFQYTNNFPHIEDTDLFMRVARLSDWKFYNIPEVLLKYRIYDHQISFIQNDVQNKNYRLLLHEHLYFYGYNPNQDEINIHFDIIANKKFATDIELKQANDWLSFVYTLKNEKLCDSYYVFREKLLLMHLNNSHIDASPNIYYSSPLVNPKKLCFLKEKNWKL